MSLVFVLLGWSIFGIVFIKWGDWKRYYPTVIYYCVVNLYYDYLYYNHRLWTFQPTSGYLNHTLVLTAFVFVIIPIAIILFLQWFPRRTMGAVLYVLAWAFLFWIIEVFFHRKGMFVYDHGWNIWYSGVFDLMMLTMLWLHYKKPEVALGLTAAAALLLIYLFPVPLASLK